MEYLDFEVSVDPPVGGEYQVRARAPSGEARGRTRLPFLPDDLNAQPEAVQRALTDRCMRPSAGLR
jgi:hypothetical protein